MACIVKRPVAGAKGLLVVTDAELRAWIQPSPTLHGRLQTLKRNWIIAAHCNSASAQKIEADPLIDAYIAGPGDIAPADSRSLYQIEMDCSNFCPAFFERRPADGESFWDLLFISRNEPFKSVDDLFKIARELLNTAPVRILAIISERDAARVVDSEPNRLYKDMFTPEERKLFTLLTPWVDYPFSFDLQTLAFFYHHSRAFLHTARDERHPRVVGYAWASGIPVIAPPNVAALLPAQLAKEPGFYAFDTPQEAAVAARRALAARDPLPPAYSEWHLASFQVDRFKAEIAKLYGHLGERFVDGGWHLASLDLRLARHHYDKNAGTNSCRASLYQFAGLLSQPLPDDDVDDIEKSLDASALGQKDSPAVTREASTTARSRQMASIWQALRRGDVLRASATAARALRP